MVISAYVRIGWNVGDESTETEVERLGATAKETGRISLLTASDFLNMVLVKRSEDPRKEWEWDDGLDPNFYFS